jgi:hypothetical protein
LPKKFNRIGAGEAKCAYLCNGVLDRIYRSEMGDQKRDADAHKNDQRELHDALGHVNGVGSH